MDEDIRPFHVRSVPQTPDPILRPYEKDCPHCLILKKGSSPEVRRFFRTE
jgi:hypothetical protein